MLLGKKLIVHTFPCFDRKRISPSQVLYNWAYKCELDTGMTDQIFVNNFRKNSRIN